MELSEDAGKMMENRVARIMKGIDVPDSDKAEIKKELLSNFIDASIIKAQARGATSVEASDMAAVLESSEKPEDTASAYMSSYIKSLKRAGIFSRSIAFLIDMLIILLVTWLISVPFFVPIYMHSLPAPGAPLSPHAPPSFMAIMFTQLFSQYLNIFLVSNLVMVFVYFVLFEGYLGYTPGKWILGLKVIGEDGKKVDFKETMLRSITKPIFLMIMIDAALMLFYDRKDRQRLFDRIAGTIVIKH
jgi:uncharacterized RDD family membrane protein YckC